MNEDTSNISELSPDNLEYLQFLKDIYEVSAACSTKTYFWGGFVPDILEGRFLREHGDLDGFTENMMSVLDRLTEAYESKDYLVDFRSGINMLVIRKNALHAAFNALETDGPVAMWRHIGDQGTVYFPYGWLDKSPNHFYSTEAYVSGLCFEFAFRNIACSLNPDWKEREKDRIAREYFEAKIKAANLDAGSILKCIWSYNPHWIKMGYSPFEAPTLVLPRK